MWGNKIWDGTTNASALKITLLNSSEQRGSNAGPKKRKNVQDS